MRLAMIDFETTGLTLAPTARRELQPRAIEFAGCIVNDEGVIEEELEVMINPGCEISDEITRITGITNDDLDEAGDFLQVWPTIEQFLDGVDGLVAHNLSFDAYILRNELDINGIEWSWPRVMLCTVELMEPLWGYRPRLIQLYEHITGREYEQTHRALDDVRALTEIVTDGRVFPAIAAAAATDRAYLPPELCTS